MGRMVLHAMGVSPRGRWDRASAAAVDLSLTIQEGAVVAFGAVVSGDQALDRKDRVVDLSLFVEEFYDNSQGNAGIYNQIERVFETSTEMVWITYVLIRECPRPAPARQSAYIVVRWAGPDYVHEFRAINTLAFPRPLPLR